MTRINVGVQPRELPDKLLLAEHREITRIPNLVSSGKINLEDAPEKFCLGKGHVKWCCLHLLYIKKRYYDLYNECIMRNFKVTNKSSSFVDIKYGVWKDYLPTKQDRQLIIDRIKSKNFTLLG